MINTNSAGAKKKCHQLSIWSITVKNAEWGIGVTPTLSTCIYLWIDSAWCKKVKFPVYSRFLKSPLLAGVVHVERKMHIYTRRHFLWETNTYNGFYCCDSTLIFKWKKKTQTFQDTVWKLLVQIHCTSMRFFIDPNSKGNQTQNRL